MIRISMAFVVLLMASWTHSAFATDAPAATQANAAAAKAALAAGQTITWEFPELPPILREWVEGTKCVPKATVYLPTDYTPERKFPLAVFVGGAGGALGDEANWAKELYGEKGFICVGLPTFKESIEPLKEDNSNYWNRMYIRVSEGPFIWRNYRAMLEKICSEIPNVERERGVYGGFSNGGHTAAAFLSNPAEAREFLGFFNRIVLAEGGNRLKPAADLSGCRFLLIRGGGRPQDMFRNTKTLLSAAGAKWSEFVMPLVGHEFTPEAKALIRRWVEDSR